MSKEDFISKLKKMKSDSKSPSVIAETLEKIEALEKQNIELKEKIDKNVDLVRSSEEILKKTVGEKDNLKVDLKKKNEHISGLENTIKSFESQVDNLTYEISNKNSQLLDLQNEIKSLSVDNESLNRQLARSKEKLSVDNGIPIEELEKPKPTSASSKTLEILVQDLQTDLNRYKRVIEKLKKENAELKIPQETGGAPVESYKIKDLKKENEILKKKISKLEKSLEKEATLAFEAEAADNKIKELEDELEERDNMIRELEASKTAEATTPDSSPMSGLIEDLQGKINKLKLALKEKNKIIEDLKKSDKNKIIR
jgi:chromosome segregation ATPase